MYHKRILNLIASALLAALPLLFGCGGGSSQSNLSQQTVSSQQDAGLQPFSFGSLIGRAAISSPPLTTNSAHTTVTGLKGDISELTLMDTAPTLAETRIAFSSGRDGNYEIYIMNADGTNQTRLTNNSAEDNHPALSPDSTKIAFTSNRSGNYEIYSMNVDGSNVTRLTNNSAVDHAPAWSPDGTKIAFSSARDSSYEIYVMNADGSNQTRLTNNNAFDDHPTWSPDGTKIAFASNRNGPFELFVMNANGSGQTRITGGGVEAPAWSPDGTKIAFASSSAGYKICVTDVVGASVTQLTNSNTTDDHPTWSPDGSKIAFAREATNQPEIYVMNADGTGQSALTNTRTSEVHPSWSRFVKQRSLIGPTGRLGANANGCLFSQKGKTVNNVLTFSATTPSTIVLTQQTGLNNDGPNLVFSIDADQLNSLAYVNNPDYKPVAIVGNGSTVKIAAGALVSYDSTTGEVAAVLPFTGTRAAASRKPSVRDEGNVRVFQGTFVGVWDGTGKNQAPQGASEVRIDLASGALKVK